jgi:hypothetical protein
VLKQLLADKRSENTRMRAVLFMVWWLEVLIEKLRSR